MAIAIKTICDNLVTALQSEEDGKAIRALIDLSYDSVCRTLRLDGGGRASLAIRLSLLAKRAGEVINLTEEVRAPVTIPTRAPAPINTAPAINENEVLEVEIALAELDKALAKDAPSYEGDVNPSEEVEDEVLSLSTEGALIDRLFYELEKPTITDEQMAQVITANQPKGKQFDITTAELDLTGEYELTNAPEETIVPEKGYGMDFGFITLGE